MCPVASAIHTLLANILLIGYEPGFCTALLSLLARMSGVLALHYKVSTKSFKLSQALNNSFESTELCWPCEQHGVAK